MKIFYTLTAGLMLMSSAAAMAANPLLGVQIVNPNIYSQTPAGSSNGCSYNGADTLSINGTPLTLTLASGDAPQFFSGGTTTASLSIDPGGTFSGGSITVTGIVGAYGSPVLTGDVTDYGIADFGATDRLEILFSVTGGSLATDFGGVGAEAGGIIFMESSTYAGSFGTSWGCGVIKADVGPTPAPPTGSGTGTIGYWKTHPEAWPVTSLTIGDQTLGQNDLIWYLNAAVKGNKMISMVKQLIGAKLNVEAGNDSSCIDATIAAADTWVIAHGGIGAVQRQWDGGDLIHDELDAYNNGLLCAPHRD